MKYFDHSFVNQVNYRQAAMLSNVIKVIVRDLHCRTLVIVSHGSYINVQHVYYHTADT